MVDETGSVTKAYERVLSFQVLHPAHFTGHRRWITFSKPREADRAATLCAREEEAQHDAEEDRPLAVR
jgi:hypothetical protein